MTPAPPVYPAGHHNPGRALATAITLIVAAPTWPVRADGPANRVEMKDVAFAPDAVTVYAGDTVVWKNRDIVAHTATSEQAGFDVEVPPGSNARAVITQPGTFTYSGSSRNVRVAIARTRSEDIYTATRGADH